MKFKNITTKPNYLTTPLVILIAMVVIVCLPITIFFGQILQWTEQRETNCEVYQTTTVSINTENYICNEPVLGLYIDRNICEGDIGMLHEDVINLFNDVITEGHDTYADVENLLGQFEISCTSEEARANLDSYNCTYDFVDMSPIVRVSYNSENIALSVRSLGCGG